MLHGLQSQRGLYDNRPYAGKLSEFCYDVTQAGVDAWAVGLGSSSAGLEDFIGFHSSRAPSGYEIGYYGIEGNGVDNHSTGTKVTTGTGNLGGCNGGSSVPGGLDYQFDTVTAEGSCFGGFSRADNAELAARVAAGEFSSFTFPTPGSPAQIWDVAFSGTYTGAVTLTFAYDGTLLPTGFDESTLAIHHFSSGAWQTIPGTVDPLTHTIVFSSDTLGSFALGVDGARHVPDRCERHADQ